MKVTIVSYFNKEVEEIKMNEMKKDLPVYIIILSIIIGCKSRNTDNVDFITVDVTKSYPKKELILQDFLDVEYIPLETNDEFITSASLQAMDTDILLIKDHGWISKGDIFIFDRNGKGLRKINRVGQGREEYTDILDIAMDTENDEIYINNHFAQKIVVYDLYGNFKRSIKQKEGVFYNLIANFDRDHLICHDGHFEIDKPEIKRNYFLIVSKEDGSIQEIPIPFKEKKSRSMMMRDANGKVISKIYSIYNKPLIPYQGSWLITELSADTIYSYSQEHVLKPFIVRVPSIHSMDTEVFLFPGVLTENYYFMQTIKRI